MIKCEECHKVIGECSEFDGTKRYNLYVTAKIMPCCGAEVCTECFEEIQVKTSCPFCGKLTRESA